MNPVGMILTSVILGVVGQLLLKASVARIGPLTVGRGGLLRVAWRIWSQPGIWGGFALYGISLVFWLLALSRVELSFAYPFLSLSYVLVLLASWLLFHEEIAPLRLLGVAAICVGVYVVAAG